MAKVIKKTTIKTKTDKKELLAAVLEREQVFIAGNMIRHLAWSKLL